MNLKKVIALGCAALLMAGLFAGCGNDKAEEENQAETTQVTETTEAEPEATAIVYESSSEVKIEIDENAAAEDTADVDANEVEEEEATE